MHVCMYVRSPVLLYRYVGTYDVCIFSYNIPYTHMDAHMCRFVHTLAASSMHASIWLVGGAFPQSPRKWPAALPENARGRQLVAKED